MTHAPRLTDMAMDALKAASAAIQFCNSMAHEPMRALAQHMWDECTAATAAGADILLTDKSGIMRGSGSGEGKLYYVPYDVRDKLQSQEELDPDKDAAIMPKCCEMRRITAPTWIVDLHMLQYGKAEQALADNLRGAMAELVAALRETDADVAVATMPEISLSHGETPIEVRVHMYGLMGALPC